MINNYLGITAVLGITGLTIFNPISPLKPSHARIKLTYKVVKK